MNLKNEVKKIFIKIFKSSRKCKGFTLVETAVAVFIFAIAIVMLMGSYSSINKTYVNAKEAQKNIEEVQYALNAMAKTLRTSDIDVSAGSGTSLYLNSYDYSQDKCIRYEIMNNSIAERIYRNRGTSKTIATCNWSRRDSTDYLIPEGTIVGSKSGMFYNKVADPLLSLIVFKIAVQDGNKTVLMQTAVSTRVQ